MDVPHLLYGTAWKEERTALLVSAALAAGFRGIDTANQRKHYHEAGVGAALKDAFASGLVTRGDLFLQTKFTHARGQARSDSEGADVLGGTSSDQRLPYDPRAPVAQQVAQSFASSLQHLGVERLDAYLLHGPSSYPDLSDADREAWRAMEELHDDGCVARIGISNVLIEQLRELHAAARVKPTVVQNRTFAMPDADREVRAFCRAHDIAYEGFSLLTAVPHVVAHPVLRAIAARAQCTPAQAVLRWCRSQDIIVLTGTTSQEHMAQDLAAPRGIALSAEDLDAIEGLLP